MALGMLVMRIVMMRRGFGQNPIRLIPRMLMLSIAGLAILALAPGGLIRHAISALLYSAGFSMMHTLVNAHILDIVAPQRRGAAFGASLFSFDIGLGALGIGGLIGLAEPALGANSFRVGWATSGVLALAALPLARHLVRVSRKPSLQP
jgi:MFS family permease